jgi:predicted TIM-barrel fold metal-dependent hydrolase
LEELAAYVPEPWRTKLLQRRIVHPHNGYPNPIATHRRDAAPPSGGQPGSDPAFVVSDLIERFGMDYAVLVGESAQLAISAMANPDAAAALASGYNDWLVDCWFRADARFLGSIFIATQDPLLAAREIERVGAHPQFVQVNVGSGARFPYGQRFYYPIYETAERLNLPIAVHPLTEGSHIFGAPTPAGYPSYYYEYHTLATTALQAHLASLIAEGVFERFPRLRFVFVEGSVGWLAPLLWRMDKEWKSLRSETPWVRRLPSAYVRDHIRLTTQPLDEPDDPAHLRQLLAMFPAEEILMFSSDYPHWDFDDPTRVFNDFPADFRRRIFYDNARQLYGL